MGYDSPNCPENRRGWGFFCAYMFSGDGLERLKTRFPASETSAGGSSSSETKEGIEQ